MHDLSRPDVLLDEQQERLGEQGREKGENREGEGGRHWFCKMYSSWTRDGPFDLLGRPRGNYFCARCYFGQFFSHFPLY